MGVKRLAECSSEDDVQQYLEDKFEANGWTAIREVSPHRSNYRIDLLLIHERYGKVGIEVKYIGAGEGGRVFAEAHQQITQQYWDKKYLGDRIGLWAIAPFFEHNHHDREDWHQTYAQGKGDFAREFFCKYGIGYLDLNDPYGTIDFGYSIAEYKIPAFPMERELPDRHTENCDVAAIRASVRKKRGID